MTLGYVNYMSLKLIYIYLFLKSLIGSPLWNNKNISPGIWTGWNCINSVTTLGDILGGVFRIVNPARVCNQYIGMAVEPSSRGNSWKNC